jgi:FG-GAP-like repeat/Abnormal spindle-like microcephaly-assoc'd, ASPM-SPD-2-Hydin
MKKQQRYGLTSGKKSPSTNATHKRSPFVLAVCLLLTATPWLAGSLLAQSNPVPMITQPLVPVSAAPGGAGFTITVTGSGFVPGSVIQWNGGPLVTSFVNFAKLTASVPRTSIAAASTAAVTVLNPGVGAASNTVFFPITDPVPVINLSSSASSVSSPPTFIALGDFNGDGKLDAATANAGGDSVSILLGNDDGTFQTPLTFAAGTNPLTVLIGDFNGDGKLDLAVNDFRGGTVSVLLGNGDGTFQSPKSSAGGTGPLYMVVGDFNGDGKLDVAVAGVSDGRISMLLGNGDGTFQSPVIYGTPVFASGMAAADVDGDGKLDLVVTSGASTLYIVLGNGDGTFRTPLQSTAGTSPAGLTVADFNGDGKPDLAIANFSNSGPGSISLLMGNGDGTFRSEVQYAVGKGQGWIAAGDINGDGKLDLVASGSAYSTTVSVLLGNGDGTFQPYGDYSAGQSDAVALGDLNGDGKLDVVVPNSNASEVEALLQTGTVTLSAGNLSFGTEVVGVTGAQQTVTLTNTGAALLGISGIVVNGADASDFAETNTCPSGLAGGASCSLSAMFTPAAMGGRSAYVSISNSASNSPLVVTLMGAGQGTAAVTLSPASLNFGTENVGGTSPVKAITLTNTGSAPLVISSIGISGANPADFLQNNTCAFNVAAGASCQFMVNFAPKATGARSAVIFIADNAGGSPQMVALTGTGIGVPVLALSPNAVNFNGQVFGVVSAPRTVTLQNIGTATALITSVTLDGANPGDYAQTNNCGASLTVQGTCTFTITFTPTALGKRPAQLLVISNSRPPKTGTGLNGTGLSGVSLKGRALNFAPQKVGTTSPVKAVTVTYMGAGTLTISSIKIIGANPGDFAQTNNCGAGLSAGGSCSISVTFTPTALGARAAVVNISDSDPALQQSTLKGTGK